MFKKEVVIMNKTNESISLELNRIQEERYRYITLEALDKAIEESGVKGWKLTSKPNLKSPLVTSEKYPSPYGINLEPWQRTRDKAILENEIESFDRICAPMSKWARFKHWFKRKTNWLFHWYDIYGKDREPLYAHDEDTDWLDREE